MNITKAIHRLQRYIKWRKPDPDDNFHESVQLGIEALKRVKRTRDKRFPVLGEELPGETKD